MINRLRGNTKVLGECLKGAVALIDAQTREDPGAALSAFVVLAEPCKKSEEILKEIEALNEVETTKY